MNSSTSLRLPPDSADLARALIEEAADALFLFDPDNEQLLDVSAAAVRLTGFGRERLLHMPASYLFRFEGKGGKERLRAASQKSGVQHPQEGYLLRTSQDGVWVPVSLSVSRLHVRPRTLALYTVRDVREQRETHRQLKRLEEELAQVTAAIAACLWSAEIGAGRWEYKYWSAAVEKITGRPADFFFPGPERWAEIVHPEDRLAWRDSLAQMRGSGSSERTPCRSAEYRIILPDGSGRWVRESITVSPREGRAVRFDAVVSDVTDRRLAEEALLDQRAMLQNVIDHTPCAVFWKDRSSVYLGCNVQSAQDLGLASSNEAIGKTDGQMQFSSEEADFYVSCDRRVMETGQALLQIEETQQRPDGSRAILLTSKVPLRSAAGEVVGVLGVYTDITQRKNMEEALRQSEQRYREVVEGSIQGILIHQEGKIEFANRSLARMFGYEDSAELIGLNSDVLIAPDDQPLLQSRRQRCLDGEALPFIEWQGLRKDGSRVWIQSTVTAIVWNGRPALLSTRLDITERKRLEEQLRQAQKMEAVGRLAGGIAHDFNNLIQIITGCGEVVLGDLPAVHPCRDMVREMKNAGDRAAGLTRQLLAFSRRQILAPQLLDLSVVAQDASRLLERLIGEDIELVTGSELGLALVRADPNQVEQVLLNLAVNARDAMPQGGKLTIETRNVELDEVYLRSNPEARSGPHVLLAVSDTGCGMDEATRARIFEPFFTTKGECGTGLGLATVYGIVRQSGGHIAVYSEVGRGTTFKIYLPRAGEVTKARKSEARHAAVPRGTETVLLVEDEDGVRALASHVLRDCGYRVLEARQGLEALRVAAEQGKIELLVTDVVMPHLGGRELAERLVLSHPQARVLFLSGYTDDAVVRHGILDEEVAFLQKPFTTAALARKVREVLDQ